MSNNAEDDYNHGMKIDAETSKQYEVGVKWQLFDDRLFLDSLRLLVHQI